MAGKVLSLGQLGLDPDNLAAGISQKYNEWQMGRQQKVSEWNELRRYIYATDTRHTSAGKLPWSNSTTLPKLTQIRDNLFANYMAAMFPKRKWLNWEGASPSDEDQLKVNSIKNYMMWCINQPEFKREIAKSLLDYIDMGNSIMTVEWVDRRIMSKTGMKLGFVGPLPKRLSPLDTVFNPIVSSFTETPKIHRSLQSLGEAKEILQRMSQTPEQKEIAMQVYQKIWDARETSRMQYVGWDLQNVDDYYSIDGFTSYKHYLDSDYCELLTFAGDIYDRERDELKKARLIVVIDRCCIAIDIPYPYPQAEIPIFHSGWRTRQDNLWAMGPLDNLVGLQYRLDHVENMKADIFDLITYPPIMVRGSASVGDFNWGPMERIYVDSDGDVSIKSPDVNALQANLELTAIEQRMEEMAGSPKEAMGFRTPGEKTAYEVQRLENAAARIFQNKISQWEEDVLEPTLNAQLTLAKENLDDTTIRTIDSELGVVGFQTITRADLSANGRLKPIAARHFAEQAELIQNITNWSQTPLGQDEDVKVHFSGLKLAQMVEDALNLQDYELFLPYVRVSEEATKQKLMNQALEGIQTEAGTPSGLTPDDFAGNLPQVGGGPPGLPGPQGPPGPPPQAGPPLRGGGSQPAPTAPLSSLAMQRNRGGLPLPDLGGPAQ